MTIMNLNVVEKLLENLKVLREYFKEEMYLICKNFPIVRMHPSVLLPTQILEYCALQQKYLQAHDFIFECQEFLEYQVKPFLKLWLNESLLKNEIKKIMKDSNEEIQSKDKREILVFLHYFGGSAASWDWVIEKLSKDYQCIAITLPGFGSSPAMKKSSIQAFAEFVQKELDSVGIKNYSLVGHSMGGKIAMQIAVNAPKDTIQQLILIAPSPPTTENTPEKEKELMLHHTQPHVAEKLIKSSVKKTLTKVQFDLALKTQLSTDLTTWRWWILDGMKHSIANNIHSLDLPVTILASDDDPVMTSEVIKEQVMPYLNNAKLVTIEGVGHLSPFEAPEWIAEQIRNAMEVNNQKKEKKPTISYWHVWTDEDGVSHQTKAALTSFKKESMTGDIEPQWNNHLLGSKSKVLFSELPVDWIGEWHENPKPQWIIPISGGWYVETMDGHRVEMGPGDVSFGGDQNTKPNEQGHKGHLSGTIGKEPAQLMIIQLMEDKWIGAKPGKFS